MYLMNILSTGMLYHGHVVRQVLSWANVRRPPAPCGSGCHNLLADGTPIGDKPRLESCVVSQVVADTLARLPLEGCRDT